MSSMPTENNRVMKLLELVNPDAPDPSSEDAKFKVPVIVEISFKDPKGQNWVSRLRIDNTGGEDQPVARQVHTVTVGQGNSSLEVERIEKMTFKDAKDNNWVAVLRAQNDDPPPRTPDSNTPSHKKTHVVRYYKDNDTTQPPWADFELIDEFKVKDPKSRNQELTYRLQHPPPGDPVTDDLDDPFASDATIEMIDFQAQDLAVPDGGEINPPWRFDPFRNCINIKWGEEKHLIVGWALDSTVQPGEAQSVFTAGPSVTPPEQPAGEIIGLRDSPDVNCIITLTADHARGPGGEDIGQPQIACSPTTVGGSGTSIGSPFITFDTHTAPPLIRKGQVVPGFYAVSSIPFKVTGVPLSGPGVFTIGAVPDSYDVETGEQLWYCFNAFYWLIDTVSITLATGSVTWATSFTDTNGFKWKAIGANAGEVYYVPATEKFP